MIDPQFWSIERAAGLFLVLGDIVVLLPGLLLFWFRSGQRGGAPPSPAYYMWERGLILAAIVLTAIGFMVLEARLQATDGRVLARASALAYLFAGVLGVAAEALTLSQGYQSDHPAELKVYGLLVVYVLLAFLAQAAIGGSLLLSGVLAAWLGWATILWNLAWLVVLPISATCPGRTYGPTQKGALAP